MKLLSLIIPCFNVERFIPELCAQLHNSPEENCEFIFVDDCSPSNERETVDNFVSIDERFRLLKLPENVGLSEARNQGAAIADGKFLAFLDGDDQIYLDVLIDFLATLSDDIQLAVVGYESFSDADGEIIPGGPAKTLLNNVSIENAPLALPILHPVWCHITLASHFHAQLKFEGRQREDRDFCFRSFVSAKNISVNTGLVVFKYRQLRVENNSIMQSEMTDEGISYFLQHIKRFSRDIDKTISVGDQATRLFAFSYLNSISWEFYSTVSKYDHLTLEKFCQELMECTDEFLGKYLDLFSKGGVPPWSLEAFFPKRQIAYLIHLKSVLYLQGNAPFPEINNQTTWNIILLEVQKFSESFQTEILSEFESVFHPPIGSLLPAKPLERIVIISGHSRDNNIQTVGKEAAEALPKDKQFQLFNFNDSKFPVDTPLIDVFLNKLQPDVEVAILLFDVWAFTKHFDANIVNILGSTAIDLIEIEENQLTYWPWIASKMLLSGGRPLYSKSLDVKSRFETLMSDCRKFDNFTHQKLEITPFQGDANINTSFGKLELKLNWYLPPKHLASFLGTALAKDDEADSTKALAYDQFSFLGRPIDFDQLPSLYFQYWLEVEELFLNSVFDNESARNLLITSSQVEEGDGRHGGDHLNIAERLVALRYNDFGFTFDVVLGMLKWIKGGIQEIEPNANLNPNLKLLPKIKVGRLKTSLQSRLGVTGSIALPLPSGKDVSISLHEIEPHQKSVHLGALYDANWQLIASVRYDDIEGGVFIKTGKHSQKIGNDLTKVLELKRSGVEFTLQLDTEMTLQRTVEYVCLGCGPYVYGDEGTYSVKDINIKLT